MASTEIRKLTKMPDLTGVPLEKARLMVRNAGLEIDAVLYRQAYEKRNTVLEQKPSPRQMVYIGDKVSLWVARRGYIQFLPALYRRSDPTGRNFIRDVLFIIEHMMSPVDDVLDRIDSYFNPYETPDEFVDWLAGWSAMVLDMDWPIEKKRAVVRKAVELYNIRGTVKGLKIFLSLFTGYEPNIIENQWPFRGFRIGDDESAIGIDSVILPPVNVKSCFIVEIPAKFQDVSLDTVIRVHDIIQAEKPAHTSYYLRFLAEGSGSELREFFTIGMRSGIGIGMEVTEEAESDDPSSLPSAVDVIRAAISQPRISVSSAPPAAPAVYETPKPPQKGAESAPKPVETKPAAPPQKPVEAAPKAAEAKAPPAEVKKELSDEPKAAPAQPPKAPDSAPAAEPVAPVLSKEDAAAAARAKLAARKKELADKAAKERGESGSPNSGDTDNKKKTE